MLLLSSQFLMISLLINRTVIIQTLPISMVDWSGRCSTFNHCLRLQKLLISKGKSWLRTASISTMKNLATPVNSQLRLKNLQFRNSIKSTRMTRISETSLITMHSRVDISLMFSLSRLSKRTIRIMKKSYLLISLELPLNRITLLHILHLLNLQITLGGMSFTYLMD